HSGGAAGRGWPAWLAFRGLPTCSEKTGTYGDARKRLPVAVVPRLVHETARRAEAEAPEARLWKGRRVYLVDGTTVSMPDTPANQAAFPQSRTQKRGLGFPTARLVVLISLWTPASPARWRWAPTRGRRPARRRCSGRCSTP